MAILLKASLRSRSLAGPFYPANSIASPRAGSTDGWAAFISRGALVSGDGMTLASASYWLMAMSTTAGKRRPK